MPVQQIKMDYTSSTQNLAPATELRYEKKQPCSQTIAEVGRNYSGAKVYIFLMNSFYIKIIRFQACHITEKNFDRRVIRHYSNVTPQSNFFDSLVRLV